ncbi:MAG TPA: restriction endonuclease subunit R, partial [Ruminococcaceae bacterium]|nr:restriction endonuclease subunit R [Oscillospiraceae bacterium]
MKFNFKIQQYQTDAVEAVVSVFNGQRHYDRTTYIRDLGKVAPQPVQMRLETPDEYGEQLDLTDELGYKNENIELSDEQLLHNIRERQTLNNIRLSDELSRRLGRCSLDIEMETGTGKTYVYI